MWFITLFSLILILSVYYITMPSELLTTMKTTEKTSTTKAKSEVSVTESDFIAALQVEKDEERSALVAKYNEILNVRMNPNCAETICFLCYYVLKKSNIIVGMSLDDYLQFSYVNDKDETIFLTYDEFKNRNSLNNIKQLLNNNELNNELNDELSDIINFSNIMQLK